LFFVIGSRKKAPLDRGAAYWGQFKDATDLRNVLQPKAPALVTEASVERALLAILQLLDITYRRIYSKKYPGRKRGLQIDNEL